MRKIIILLLLPFFCNAQISSRITRNIALNETNRTANGVNVTTKTLPGSITPQNVGSGIDSAMKRLDSAFTLMALGGVCGCDLQTTTDNGNKTTNSMMFGTGTVASPTTGFAFLHGLPGPSDLMAFYSSGTLMGGMGTIGGVPTFSLYNSGFSSSMRPSRALGGNRASVMPSELYGLGSIELDSTIVTHSTGNDMLIGTGSLATPISGLLMKNDGSIRYYDGSITGMFNRIVAGTLTASRATTLGDYSGEILLNKGGTSTQTITGTTMVIAHGLAFTPRVSMTPLNAGAAGLTGVYFTVDATNITINFAAVIATSISYSWQAFK